MITTNYYIMTQGLWEVSATARERLAIRATGSSPSCQVVSDMHQYSYAAQLVRDPRSQAQTVSESVFLMEVI